MYVDHVVVHGVITEVECLKEWFVYVSFLPGDEGALPPLPRMPLLVWMTTVCPRMVLRLSSLINLGWCRPFDGGCESARLVTDLVNNIIVLTSLSDDALHMHSLPFE